MALTAGNVRVAVTGAVMTGLTSATAPSGTGGSTTGFADLGYVNEEGVTITFPEAGDSTPIKAWQNGATVRTVRSLTEDNPTITFTLLETSIASVEAALGVSVTDGVSEGSFEFDTTDAPVSSSWIVDVVDGSELVRVYVPKGTPTGGLELVFQNQEPIGYNVTLDCERNTTLGYNLKVWATALKTPA
jgi:hypothetical protein